MTRLRISAEALADLDDTWFHIAKDSEVNAAAFSTGFLPPLRTRF
jgi:plasmid stabilization system protein ParE